MDDVDLPPVPSSARKAASTAPPRPSLLLSRKRTHNDYDEEIATSSDPAFFSSDEHAPDAENYVSGKRKKHTYQGSWWDHRRVKMEGKRKREFRRNFDSGVFMGSETSDEALSSDSLGLEDELLRDQQSGKHNSRDRRASGLFNIESVETTPKAKVVQRPSAPAIFKEHEEVCQLVQGALDQGKEDVDLSSMSLSTLPPEVSSLQTLSKQTEIVPGMLDVGTDLEAKLRLYLANNLFTQLPTPILDLSNLRVLSLRQNNLTSVPPAIRDLVNLESLNVAGNQLRELPFEIIELIKRHSLQTVYTDPNPFLRPSPALKPDEGYHFFNTSESGPALFRACSSETFNDKSTAPSNVPSLRELTLRKLSQIESVPRIDFQDFMPADTPLSILEDLGLLKSQPVRRCSRCHRPIVRAAKEWMEWWVIGSIHGKQIPFTRLQCSDQCDGEANAWCYD